MCVCARACVCESERETERDDTVFSVVGLFYVLRVARKFDFRLAVTPNKGRLIFLKKLHHVARLMFLAGSVYFHPDRRREC